MKSAPLNYFSFETAAKRYARGRPYFHPIVKDAILRKRAGLPRPACALDVACGTGLSTRILAEMSDHAVGIDSSAEMLAETPELPNVEYIVASAERLPFPPGLFDLVTVALAFHWFDRVRFLREAHRVLKPGGMLVIYNHWFCGATADPSDYAQWHQNHYLNRYPTPSRDTHPFGATDAAAAGFRFEGEETFSNQHAFTIENLAHYLVTQSNVIAAVETGREPIEEAFAWIVRGASAFFRTDQEAFLFEGAIAYLSRDASEPAAHLVEPQDIS